MWLIEGLLHTEEGRGWMYIFDPLCYFEINECMSALWCAKPFLSFGFWLWLHAPQLAERNRICINKNEHRRKRFVTNVTNSLTILFITFQISVMIIKSKRQIISESSREPMFNCSNLTYMHRAVSHCAAAVWLSSSSRRTEGGEGRRELTQRETGVLISDGLTGCVDRALAQEEEKRCNEGTSCLKKKSNKKKKRNKTAE